MGHRRRGYHVRGTWADRGRAGHHPAAPARLGEGDRGQCHRLLVVRTQCRQTLPCRVQRLAQAGDVTVAENCENARKERMFVAIDLARLCREEADERLRHREADCGHTASFFFPWRDRITGGRFAVAFLGSSG